MQHLLEVEQITKTYHQGKDTEVTAIENVDFRVSEREIVGLLGPNGAGKTTTIKCISGLIRQDSGKVLVNGYDVENSQEKVQENIGTVLEGNRNIYWRLTPEENMEFFLELGGKLAGSGREKIDELIRRFDLEDKKKTPARELSRGMKQKVALGSALIKDPKLLVLDEPTLGLDVEASKELQRTLTSIVEEEERAVLLSSHQMDVVQNISERAVILDQGKVVVDKKVDELLENFQTQGYLLEFEKQLGEMTEKKMKNNFEVLELSNGEVPSAKVALSRPKRIYQLMDVLKGHEVTITSIESQGSNLEEVFLKTIKSKEQDEVEER
jgi:ABC-2 type transport system ATP-binding protein